ncbi:ankyrin repeat, PH and SEC7 domain containing protein secG-like isoform X2 [Schistocerca gregaria]|uniref:ankyrin repeat, PH and SEC7 domain containing protein secG-like isoform X2 n=1 Tax=Schistocerca gregaria TaxID=7010 RepID=UPI00211DF1FD|nr:ankyrin repeat, PH and SEC7 domain containing protein secG-like isoform X2 [Schistocerca gregaria]
MPARPESSSASSTITLSQFCGAFLLKRGADHKINLSLFLNSVHLLLCTPIANARKPTLSRMGGNLSSNTVKPEDINAIIQKLSGMVQHEGSSFEGDTYTDVQKALDTIKDGGDVDIERLNDIRDNEGNSLFHVLVLDEEIRLVRLLLETGCHVRTANHRMKSPLHMACEKGCLKIVKLILEYGGYDVCMASDDAGNYPLHSAVLSGNKEVFCAVLRYCQREVNELNKEEKAPLHLIAQSGNIELAKTLFEDVAKNFVDINIAGSKGITPLHLATRYGHAKICDLLLSLGADPSATTWLGETPLHVSCWFSEECANRILLADSLLRMLIKEERSKIFSVHHLFRERRTKSSPNIEKSTSSALVDSSRKRVIVESRDVYGNFPLHYACMTDQDMCASMGDRWGCEGPVRDQGPMSISLIEKMLKLEALHAKYCKWWPSNTVTTPNLFGYSCADIVKSFHPGNKRLLDLLERHSSAYLEVQRPLTSKGAECIKIQLASDLHIECLEFNQKANDIIRLMIRKSECDYLALLGDIGLVNSPYYKKLLYTLADQYKKVFFLLGNHEYYDSAVQEVEEEVRRMCKDKKSLCYLTSDRSYLVDGFRIVGCTLWSEVRPEDVRSVSECMRDYHRIKIDTEVRASDEENTYDVKKNF